MAIAVSSVALVVRWASGLESNVVSWSNSGAVRCLLIDFPVPFFLSRVIRACCGVSCFDMLEDSILNLS